MPFQSTGSKYWVLTVKRSPSRRMKRRTLYGCINRFSRVPVNIGQRSPFAIMLRRKGMISSRVMILLGVSVHLYLAYGTVASETMNERISHEKTETDSLMEGNFKRGIHPSSLSLFTLAGSVCLKNLSFLLSIVVSTIIPANMRQKYFTNKVIAYS